MIPRLLSRPWIQVLFYGIAFSILGILFASNVGVTNDSWWHLRTGQEIWEGTFSFYDSYSWTAAGAYWPAHELGFEWLLYGLWSLAGETFSLMGLLNIALMLGSFALLIPSKKLRERFNVHSNILIPILIFAIGFTILGFVQIRAQGISFFLFALTIKAILSKKPYWIPIIFLAWVWLHGSVFIGVALAGFATLVIIGRWLLEFKNKEKGKDALNFSIAGVLALSATCLSPLGIGLWTYFFEALSFSKTNVSEWQPLFTSPNLLTYALVVFGLVLLAIWRLWKNRNSWELIFLLGATVFMFIYGLTVIRVYSNFALMAIPLLSIFLMSFTPNKAEGSITPAKNDDRVILKLSSGLIGALVAIAVVFSVSINSQVLKNGSHDPFEAGGVAETLRNELCTDALWNDYDTGSYMIWFLPDIPVSVDSRFDLYPEWVTATAGVITRDGEDRDPTKLLNQTFAKYDIHCLAMNQSEDTESLKKRGLKVLAENIDIVVFEIPKSGIPPRIED